MLPNVTLVSINPSSWCSARSFIALEAVVNDHSGLAQPCRTFRDSSFSKGAAVDGRESGFGSSAVMRAVNFPVSGDSLKPPHEVVTAL